MIRSSKHSLALRVLVIALVAEGGAACCHIGAAITVFKGGHALSRMLSGEKADWLNARR